MATKMRMRVITGNETAKRRIVRAFVDGPIFTSCGDYDFVCGECGALLLQNVQREQYRNKVFTCMECGSLNEVPPAIAVS